MVLDIWKVFLCFLIGVIVGLCIVFGLIGLFICIHQQRRKQKSKNGSTDTLKTTSDHFNGIPSVPVNDTNSCLYYPSNQPRISYYNDEITHGVYSIQRKIEKQKRISRDLIELFLFR